MILKQLNLIAIKVASIKNKDMVNFGYKKNPSHATGN